MDLLYEILAAYHEIDQKIRRVKMATGMRCPARCGICCATMCVETTSLEALPLSYGIFMRDEAERVLAAIEEKTTLGEGPCVLFQSDPIHMEMGRCSYYNFRPLICRMFGFAVRRNKHGRFELAPCRIMKERSPESIIRAETGLSEGLSIPVYQDSFMRIASLHPGMGYRRLPINQALKEALEYVYWRRPKRRKRAAA